MTQSTNSELIGVLEHVPIKISYKYNMNSEIQHLKTKTKWYNRKSHDFVWEGQSTETQLHALHVCTCMAMQCTCSWTGEYFICDWFPMCTATYKWTETSMAGYTCDD